MCFQMHGSELCANGQLALTGDYTNYSGKRQLSTSDLGNCCSVSWFQSAGGPPAL